MTMWNMPVGPRNGAWSKGADINRAHEFQTNTNGGMGGIMAPQSFSQSPSYTSPFSGYTGMPRDLLEVNPETSYQMWSGAQGASPTGNQRYYDYSRGLYDYFQNDYYGTAANNLGLTWLDYLDTMGGQNSLAGMWGDLAPTTRGERQPVGAQWRSGPFGQVR